MASLKDMRNRIASVEATCKITKAMQMVAAARSRRGAKGLIRSTQASNAVDWTPGMSR